jgi:uncharacterized protein (TIGR02246 family)
MLAATCGVLRVHAEEFTADRAAIGKATQSYVAAFNARDPKALAAHWSPEGVYISRLTGDKVTGRPALEKEFAALFARQKDAQLRVTVKSVDFVSPNVALEQGTATVLNPADEPTRSDYSAVHVKRDGAWLIDRVSEETIRVAPSHYEQLKDLDWMVGEWVDRAGEDVVTTECHWSRNKNHLIRSFTVSVAGAIDMAGMQIIGWDPAQKQIRSWVFDSDGGFVEGRWQQSGDQWTVSSTATLPDGKQASFSSIFKPLDRDSFTWQKVNRVVDGQIQPNLDEIVIVRKGTP